MSLNLISSLSFLKNKFESVGHGPGPAVSSKKGSTAAVLAKSTSKMDLFAGITESDLDDSSSSSEDDSDDELSSKVTSKGATPSGTGYSTPDSRTQDSKASRPESGEPTADILQKCLDILNSDISDSETLPQPDVVNNKDEEREEKCKNDLVKPTILPDYSQGLLKIASPRREDSGHCTKTNKSAQHRDTFQSLSVQVGKEGCSARARSPSLGRVKSPDNKRARLSSTSSTSSWDDDDLGPPVLEPMVSLVKTSTVQSSLVNTSCTSSQQSKCSSVVTTTTTAAATSAPVPSANFSHATTLTSSTPLLQSTSSLATPSSQGPVQRILLPPVPAGQAQQIIIQPPPQLQPQPTHILQQQQSFLGPGVPTVQIVQAGQPLQLVGNPLPLLSSSGQLLGSLGGVSNPTSLLNNLQSFTAVLQNNNAQVTQQNQHSLLNYVHNNNQFPQFPILQQTSVAPGNPTVMQPKLIHPQPVVIKEEVPGCTPITRSTLAQPQQLISNMQSGIHQNGNLSYCAPINFNQTPVNVIAPGACAAGQQIILSSQNSLVAPVSQTIPIQANPPPPPPPSSIINPTPFPHQTIMPPQPVQSSVNPILNPQDNSTNTSVSRSTVNTGANISVLPAVPGSGSSPVAQLVQDPVTGLYNLVSTHMPVNTATSQTSAVSTPTNNGSATSIAGGCSTPLSRYQNGRSAAPVKPSLNTPTPPPPAAKTAFDGVTVKSEVLTSSPEKVYTPSTSSAFGVLHKPLLQAKENLPEPNLTATDGSYQLTTKFKCGVCNKYFGNTKNLRVHISEIHEGKRGQFPCDICHKVFPRKRNMERHKNALHLKNHPVCPLCQKAVVNIDVHVKRFHRGSQDHKKVSAATA